MKHNVDPSLGNLLVEIGTLVELPGNPRKGNVEAIMASYKEFGQLKPIVIKTNDDGTSTVIAGNHQVRAARQLGWTHVAAVPFEADEARAVAFALADNRISELGHTDQSLAADLLFDVIDDYGDLMEDLGWDSFEVAYIEEQAMRSEPIQSGGVSEFTPPVIQPIANIGEKLLSSFVREDDDGERKIIAPPDVDHNEIAVKGSTVTSAHANPPSHNAVVQYTIVFDSPDQQKRWYDFLRWLRSEAAFDGGTTAEKLISFIDAHSEV
jgi:hypothetical protein